MKREEVLIGNVYLANIEGLMRSVEVKAAVPGSKSWLVDILSPAGEVIREEVCHSNQLSEADTSPLAPERPLDLSGHTLLRGESLCGSRLPVDLRISTECIECRRIIRSLRLPDDSAINIPILKPSPNRRRATRNSVGRPIPTAVALYVRVSTDQQKNDGSSMESQTQLLRTAYPFGKLYVDGGVSGSKRLRDRPAGKEMLADIDAGIIGKVVVTKIDRCFRSIVDACVTITDWRDLGLDFAVLNMGGEKLDTSSPNGRFMFHIMAAFAEHERAMISERVRDTWAHAKRNGKLMGSTGHGVSRDNPKLLARMYELRREGMSYPYIAAQVTSDGYRQPNGKPYQAATVRVCLFQTDLDARNPANAGKTGRPKQTVEV